MGQRLEILFLDAPSLILSLNKYSTFMVLINVHLSLNKYSTFIVLPPQRCSPCFYALKSLTEEWFC